MKHKDLLLIRTYVSEELDMVQEELNRTVADENDADYQYLMGQREALVDVRKRIDKLIVARDKAA